MRILCLLIGYLCGMFLTATVVVKQMTGKSVFEIGSGNPGMANVMANVGKKEGVFVLTGDILKTVLALGLCKLLFWESLGNDAILFAGLGTVIGHNYPVWHKFHGGKGVTITVVTLVLGIPLWGAAASILGGVITLLTGDLWLGAILIPLIALPFAFWKVGISGGIIVLLLLLMMIQKNLDGVKRILKGEEYRRFHKK